MVGAGIILVKIALSIRHNQFQKSGRESLGKSEMSRPQIVTDFNIMNCHPLSNMPTFTIANF